MVFTGEDFDQRIMEYFIKLIKKKYSKDISKDKRALGKLRREAERAKRALSNQHQVCSHLVLDDTTHWKIFYPEPTALSITLRPLSFQNANVM